MLAYDHFNILMLDIACELGYGEKNVYYLKEKAIKKFPAALFGIQALQAI